MRIEVLYEAAAFRCRDSPTDSCRLELIFPAAKWTSVQTPLLHGNAAVIVIFEAFS
jgi:hypothetical protein